MISLGRFNYFFACCFMLGLVACQSMPMDSAMKPAKKLAIPQQGDNLIGHWHGRCASAYALQPDKTVNYQFLSHRKANGSVAIEFLYEGKTDVMTEEGRWTRHGKLLETLTTRVGNTYVNPDAVYYQDSYTIEKESANEVHYRSQKHGVLFIARRVSPSFRLTPAAR